MLNFIRRLFHRLLSVRRQAFFAVDDDSELRSPSAGTALDVIDVTPVNVGRAADFRPGKVVRQFAGFIRGGQFGVYGEHEGRVVGHAWAEVARVDGTRGRGYFPLDADEALIHYCHVDPSMRGQGVYPVLIDRLARRLFAEAGVRRVWIDTEVDNEASLRGIAKAGFRPMGTGRFVQVLGWLVYARLAE